MAGISCVWAASANFSILLMTESFIKRLSRCWHWLLRFRHRCGYGIHSPFAFGFVTGVIYERAVYYAYAELAHSYACAQQPPLRLKDYKLLFRLANFQRPDRCLVYGASASDLMLHFLKAGSRHTEYINVKGGEMVDDFTVDMAVVTHFNLSAARFLLHQLKPGGLLVIIGIDTPKSRAQWQKLIEYEPARVSFDLRDFGFIFYRPDLQREHYLINYF